MIAWEFNNMKKTFNKIRDSLRRFNYINLVYIGFFLVVVLLYWNKILSLFKPSNDSKGQNEQLSKTNTQFKNTSSITNDGYFLNGLGQKTRYKITEAREQAETLSALMNTYKGAKWYSVTLSLFGMGSVSRVKAVLNPNYPASYRRYVIATYRDVYTDYRSLQSDVISHLTGFAGTSYVDEKVRKYFIL